MSVTFYRKKSTVQAGRICGWGKTLLHRPYQYAGKGRRGKRNAKQAGDTAKARHVSRGSRLSELFKIYKELKRQNEIIFDAEKERNAWELERDDLKGLGRFVKKGELQSKISCKNE